MYLVPHLIQVEPAYFINLGFLEYKFSDVNRQSVKVDLRHFVILEQKSMKYLFVLNMKASDIVELSRPRDYSKLLSKLPQC